MLIYVAIDAHKPNKRVTLKKFEIMQYEAIGFKKKFAKKK